MASVLDVFVGEGDVGRGMQGQWSHRGGTLSWHCAVSWCLMKVQVTFHVHAVSVSSVGGDRVECGW